MPVTVQAHPGYASNAAASAKLSCARVRGAPFDFGEKVAHCWKGKEKLPRYFADSEACRFAEWPQLLTAIVEASRSRINLLGFQIGRVGLGGFRMKPLPTGMMRPSVMDGCSAIECGSSSQPSFCKRGTTNLRHVSDSESATMAILWHRKEFWASRLWRKG